MPRFHFRVLLLCAFALCGQISRAQPTPAGLETEHGVYLVHLLLHTIGTEEYTIHQLAGGQQVLRTSVTTNDRGAQRTTSAILDFGPQATPLRLEQQTSSAGSAPAPDATSLTEVSSSSVTIREAGASRTIARPAVAFAGFANMPAALQMMMMRYWLAHRQPARLPMLRASPEAPPLEIKLVGHEAFLVKGRMVRLSRYTVANLLFGREILWMNDSNRLVALMTFAGGLPQEIVLDEYAEATSSLVNSGVRQEMLDLADLERQVPVEVQGTYAIVGARLIDGTGAPALENASVLVRNGRIAASGSHVAIPPGTRLVHAEGQTLLPGLWEMHVHYSGVEFGPALLSAGITTARDCGGELLFLTTLRREIEERHALGPRLLLAGLIDAGGPLAFGAVDAETPAEGIAAVDAYADRHFNQIKVYTYLQPAVLRAIAAEAHARGLTVTGHVPAAVTTDQGIADGMDQINHLQYVTRDLTVNGKVALDSPQARETLTLLKDRHIVVDPTASWGEMAGHPRSLDPASFEPGILAAPFPLAAKFRAMGSPAADEPKFRDRMDTALKVIAALHSAGIAIVAGSDTGLLGFGLNRELELYVQAGLTPMEAIQSATLVAARAMRLDSESGTVEPGKRADLLLVDGNPLDDIRNLRHVVSVVAGGRLYSSAQLARSVGFRR